MGTSNSIFKEAVLCGLDQFREQQWHKTGDLLKRSLSIKILHSNDDYESMDIYESVRFNMFVEEYLVEYRDESELLQHLKQIEWRNRCPQLGHIFLIAGKQKEPQLCRSGERVKLYLEHMPLRLNKLNDIPFPENLYVLRQSLLGFEAIYSQYKELVIRQEHICVNYESKIKVWMNRNLISPDPESKEVRHPLKTESKIVSAIVDMISKNTDSSTEAINIKEYMRKKYRKLTFKLALAAIKDVASLLKLKIPTSLESAKILFTNTVHFSISNVKQPSTLHTVQNADSNINDSVVEEIQIPNLDLSKWNNLDISAFSSKKSDSCSTEMNTPIKPTQIQRTQINSPQQFHKFPHFPLTQRYQSHSFANKMTFGTHNLKDSDVSFIDRLQERQDLIAKAKKPIVSHSERIMISYGERKIKFSPNTKQVTQWAYWQNSKEKVALDPELVADLQLINQQL